MPVSLALESRKWDGLPESAIAPGGYPLCVRRTEIHANEMVILRPPGSLWKWF